MNKKLMLTTMIGAVALVLFLIPYIFGAATTGYIKDIINGNPLSKTALSGNITVFNCSVQNYWANSSGFLAYISIASDGTFSINDTTYTNISLNVTATGHYSQLFNNSGTCYNINNNENLTLYLYPYGYGGFNVTARDVQNNRPIPNVNLSIFNTNDQKINQKDLLINNFRCNADGICPTDSNGTVMIFAPMSAVSTGYYLQLEAADYNNVNTSTYNFNNYEGNGITTTVDKTMVGKSRVWGYVTDAYNANIYISNVNVTLVMHNTNTPLGYSSIYYYNTTTDSNGYYSIFVPSSLVKNDLYDVKFDHSAYTSNVQKGVNNNGYNGAQEVNAEMSGTFEVIGKVRDSANNLIVDGATISITINDTTFAYSTTTNSTGDYNIKIRGNTGYGIAATKTGYTQNSTNGLTASDTRPIHLTGNAKVTGILMDKYTDLNDNYIYINNGTVKFYYGGNELYNTSTDTNGEYTINVSSALTYTLVFDKSGYNHVSLIGQTFTASTNNVTTMTLTGKHKIYGTVKDAELTRYPNYTLANAVVYVNDTTHQKTYKVTGDGSGEYAVYIPSGVYYNVTVNRSGFNVYSSSVQEYATEQSNLKNIELVGTTVLEGYVADYYSLSNEAPYYIFIGTAEVKIKDITSNDTIYRFWVNSSGGFIKRLGLTANYKIQLEKAGYYTSTYHNNNSGYASGVSRSFNGVSDSYLSMNGTIHVTGTVKDLKTNNGISTAEITIKNINETKRWVISTLNSSGGFNVYIDGSDRYKVTATANGYVPETADNSGNGYNIGGNFRFWLRTGFESVVKDAANLRGISNANVLAYHYFSDSKNYTANVTRFNVTANCSGEMVTDVVVNITIISPACETYQQSINGRNLCTMQQNTTNGATTFTRVPAGLWNVTADGRSVGCNSSSVLFNVTTGGLNYTYAHNLSTSIIEFNISDPQGIGINTVDINNTNTYLYFETVGSGVSKTNPAAGIFRYSRVPPGRYNYTINHTGDPQLYNQTNGTTSNLGSGETIYVNVTLVPKPGNLSIYLINNSEARQDSNIIVTLVDLDNSSDTSETDVSSGWANFTNRQSYQNVTIDGTGQGYGRRSIIKYVPPVVETAWNITINATNYNVSLIDHTGALKTSIVNVTLWSGPAASGSGYIINSGDGTVLSKTTTTGQVWLNRIPWGSYNLSINFTGAIDRVIPVTVDWDGNYSQQFRTTPTVLKFTVKDMDGRNLQNITISVNGTGYSVTQNTTYEGVAVFNDTTLYGGTFTYTINGSAEGYNYSTTTTTLSDGIYTNVSSVLAANTLTVRIYNENGAPIQGVNITLWESGAIAINGSELGMSELTSSAGSVTFRAVPLKNYTNLAISRTGYDLIFNESGINIQYGANTISYTYQTRIILTVKTRTGTALSSIDVNLLNAITLAIINQNATNADGVVSFVGGNVTGGNYTLYVKGGSQGYNETNITFVATGGMDNNVGASLEELVAQVWVRDSQGNIVTANYDGVGVNVTFWADQNKGRIANTVPGTLMTSLTSRNVNITSGGKTLAVINFSRYIPGKYFLDVNGTNQGYGNESANVTLNQNIVSITSILNVTALIVNATYVDTTAYGGASISVYESDGDLLRFLDTNGTLTGTTNASGFAEFQKLPACTSCNVTMTKSGIGQNSSLVNIVAGNAGTYVWLDPVPTINSPSLGNSAYEDIIGTTNTVIFNLTDDVLNSSQGVDISIYYGNMNFNYAYFIETNRTNADGIVTFNLLDGVYDILVDGTKVGLQKFNLTNVKIGKLVIASGATDSLGVSTLTVEGQTTYYIAIKASGYKTYDSIAYGRSFVGTYEDESGNLVNQLNNSFSVSMNGTSVLRGHVRGTNCVSTCECSNITSAAISIGDAIGEEFSARYTTSTNAYGEYYINVSPYAEGSGLSNPQRAMYDLKIVKAGYGTEHSFNKGYVVGINLTDNQTFYYDANLTGAANITGNLYDKNVYVESSVNVAVKNKTIEFHKSNGDLCYQTTTNNNGRFSFNFNPYIGSSYPTNGQYYLFTQPIDYQNYTTASLESNQYDLTYYLYQIDYASLTLQIYTIDSYTYSNQNISIYDTLTSTSANDTTNSTGAVKTLVNIPQPLTSKTFNYIVNGSHLGYGINVVAMEATRYNETDYNTTLNITRVNITLTQDELLDDIRIRLSLINCTAQQTSLNLCTFENTTNNGYALFNKLPAGIYEITIDSTIYYSRSYPDKDRLTVTEAMAGITSNVNISVNETSFYVKFVNDDLQLMQGLINYEERVSKDNNISMDSSIAADSKGNIHAAWSNNKDGNYEIYYSIYNLSTREWSIPINISNTTADSRKPILLIDSIDNVHVLWLDETATNQIMHRKYRAYSKQWLNTSGIVSGNISYPLAKLDSADKIQLMWIAGGTDDVIQRKVSDIFADSWSSSTETVATNVKNERLAFDVDSSNNIHLTWINDTATPQIIYRFYNASSAWNSSVKVLDSNDAINSITIASRTQNDVYIIYTKDDNINLNDSTDVYAAYYTAFDGTSWSTDTRITSNKELQALNVKAVRDTGNYINLLIEGHGLKFLKNNEELNNQQSKEMFFNESIFNITIMQVTSSNVTGINISNNTASEYNEITMNNTDYFETFRVNVQANRLSSSRVNIIIGNSTNTTITQILYRKEHPSVYYTEFDTKVWTPFAKLINNTDSYAANATLYAKTSKYMVWQDNRSGSFETYYKKFGIDTNITLNGVSNIDKRSSSLGDSLFKQLRVTNYPTQYDLSIDEIDYRSLGYNTLSSSYSTYVYAGKNKDSEPANKEIIELNDTEVTINVYDTSNRQTISSGSSAWLRFNDTAYNTYVSSLTSTTATLTMIYNTTTDYRTLTADGSSSYLSNNVSIKATNIRSNMVDIEIGSSNLTNVSVAIKENNFVVRTGLNEPANKTTNLEGKAVFHNVIDGNYDYQVNANNLGYGVWNLSSLGIPLGGATKTVELLPVYLIINVTSNGAALNISNNEFVNITVYYEDAVAKNARNVEMIKTNVTSATFKFVIMQDRNYTVRVDALKFFAKNHTFRRGSLTQADPKWTETVDIRIRNVTINAYEFEEYYESAPTVITDATLNISITNASGVAIGTDSSKLTDNATAGTVTIDYVPDGLFNISAFGYDNKYRLTNTTQFNTSTTTGTQTIFVPRSSFGYFNVSVTNLFNSPIRNARVTLLNNSIATAVTATTNANGLAMIPVNLTLYPALLQIKAEYESKTNTSSSYSLIENVTHLVLQINTTTATSSSNGGGSSGGGSSSGTDGGAYPTGTPSLPIEKPKAKETYYNSIEHELSINNINIESLFFENAKFKKTLESIVGPLSQFELTNTNKVTSDIYGSFEISRSLTINYENKESTLALTISYNGKDELGNVILYDEVPKEFAGSSSEIKATASKGLVKIVEEDPSYLVFVKTLEPSESVTLTYIIDKTTTPGVLSLFRAPNVYVQYKNVIVKPAPAEKPLFEALVDYWWLFLLLILAALLFMGWRSIRGGAIKTARLETLPITETLTKTEKEVIGDIKAVEEGLSGEIRKVSKADDMVYVTRPVEKDKYVTE